MKEKLEQALKTIAAELGVPELVFTVEHPKELAHGDYATNFALAAVRHLANPPAGGLREIAELVTVKLTELKLADIEKIEVAGAGFINITLSKKFFVDSVNEIVSQKELFGKTVQFQNQVWAVEYASPNPNKAMHLGHLRNVLTGIALCNILEANGAKVIREMVDNNRGIAIAKLMWGYLVGAHKNGTRIEDIAYWANHQNEWFTPEEAGKSPDQFVDEWYVLGAKECEDLSIEEKVRGLVVQWEAKDELVRTLWQKVLSYSYAGQAQTLKRLGARFNVVWHEDEHYEEGKDFVTKGVEQGIFKTLSDGAILTNLTNYNLPDTILMKKDGTSLYITQDIALTALKKKTHHAEKLLWVIGPEQSLAMQQLFAVCEQLGIGNRSEFEHVPYGYVSIKGQGKMSSRKGNVVYIDAVLDEAKEAVATLMKDRGIDESDAIAETVAHAAVAFSILKANRLTDTAFDFETALRLEGDTGPYLQYATVRANAVLAKGQLATSNEAVQENGEVTVLEKLLYRFPEVVAHAGAELAPHSIAEYLITVAAAFNSFYAAEKIAGDAYRSALTAAFVTVMKNGLALLGIAVPERM